MNKDIFLKLSAFVHQVSVHNGFLGNFVNQSNHIVLNSYLNRERAVILSFFYSFQNYIAGNGSQKLIC